MIKYITLFALLQFISTTNLTAQIDTTLLKRTPEDTLKSNMNMDAVYNRPFLSLGKTPVSIGGYTEANWMNSTTDGISEGHQFQARRTTIFIASGINKRLKFLSEIEFEDGTKEIALEFASMDLEIHPLLNFRGGIIMNSIGCFNQNHDGPKWEFVDRPISSTQMLPSTWSNSGFGLYGKKYQNKWMFGYEFYLSGGFDNSIVDNEENKTFLPEAKKNLERFEEINSGKPMVTAKIASRHSALGELGLSYMGQVYNKYQDDGNILDKQRRVDVFAIDYNTTISKSKTYIVAEFSWIYIDVPETFLQNFGNKQHGGFIDIVQPIVSRKMFGWNKASINIACRFDYVDWNIGTFTETNGEIGDNLWSIMPAISFRPSPQTVLRFNYRHQEQVDLLGNPAALTGAFLFGFSTYF